MLAMTVRAKDLAGLHELHRAALGFGMFYRRPYRADREIIGAEGTLFTVSENSLVACTMATRNRMIIHARIPCSNAKNNEGALFAMEAPKEFDRVLRRFGDKLLALTGDGSRLEIVLPRTRNARGMISLPMEHVNGRMLSETCPEPTTTVCFSADHLVAAMKRVPRGKPWDLLAMQPSDTGLDLRYVANGVTMHEQLSATKIERSDATTPFVCSTKCVAGYVRVLKCLPKHGRNVTVQISASRIAIWNDAVTVQFFADRNPSEWTRPSTADMVTDAHEVNLFLDRQRADIPKESGKWLRSLVRKAEASNTTVETKWILSRDLVVAELDCGLQTSLELPCTSESWMLDKDRVCLSLNPLTTAAILECFEGDARGCHLAYRDGHLAVQASSRSYRLTVAATLR